jgi:hypothetical protein
MKRRIAKRWRTKARQLYSRHGSDVQAIRAELREQYGSAATFLLIAKWVIFFIELWLKLGVTEPPETPSSEEAQLVELTDEDQTGLTEE